MKTLYIFGDSIMEGIIYSEQDNKYKIRKNRFDLLQDNGIKVTNNSRMGATIEKGNYIFQKKLDLIDDNSTLLFEYGGNDCDFNWPEVSSSPNINHQPNTSPEQFILNYKQMINNAKSKGHRVVLSTLIPIDATKYMNWITKSLSYDNILSWLGDISMLSRWHEYYNTLIEKIAFETGSDIIDFRSQFLTTHEYNKCICADGIHPTEDGYQLIEETLSNYFDFC